MPASRTSEGVAEEEDRQQPLLPREEEASQLQPVVVEKELNSQIHSKLPEMAHNLSSASIQTCIRRAETEALKGEEGGGLHVSESLRTVVQTAHPSCPPISAEWMATTISDNLPPSVKAVWRQHCDILTRYGSNIEDFLRVLLYLVPIDETDDESAILAQSFYSFFDLFVLYRQTVCGDTRDLVRLAGVPAGAFAFWESVAFVLRGLRCFQGLIEVRARRRGVAASLRQALWVELFKILLKAVLFGMSPFRLHVEETALFDAEARAQNDRDTDGEMERERAEREQQRAAAAARAPPFRGKRSGKVLRPLTKISIPPSASPPSQQPAIAAEPTQAQRDRAYSGASDQGQVPALPPPAPANAIGSPSSQASQASAASTAESQTCKTVQTAHSPTEAEPGRGTQPQARGRSSSVSPEGQTSLFSVLARESVSLSTTIMGLPGFVRSLPAALLEGTSTRRGRNLRRILGELLYHIRPLLHLYLLHRRASARARSAAASAAAFVSVTGARGRSGSSSSSSSSSSSAGSAAAVAGTARDGGGWLPWVVALGAEALSIHLSSSALRGERDSRRMGEGGERDRLSRAAIPRVGGVMADDGSRVPAAPAASAEGLGALGSTGGIGCGEGAVRVGGGGGALARTGARDVDGESGRSVLGAQGEGQPGEVGEVLPSVDEVEEAELRRRRSNLGLALFRSPFFEMFLEQPALWLDRNIQRVPLLSMLSTLDVWLALRPLYFSTSGT
uniref:Peroxisomal membrane protein PEX16 n=1 Tax=Chromera velia CCMP2878 TaxID=1169474 RepID=A0A0G4HIC9_9ALVE|eukprot:Cvel_27873.t1-p1 / transcript=Cvel_27873.t1 / gene=Cvel_27873 / organism=Chromera_velia_CCMP2878 / gene_product=hypothetical protein / transcript_product=hypothetical protein / location=Cvel_scaffold3549:1011-5843(-) / protein_length=733 / sequence_SO=supercontig / SO=protein_coding / is_pseudo=false